MFLPRLIFIILLVAPLFASSSTALEGSIPLLAVSETPQGMRGSVALLSLEIRDGKGRVFLETSPVTKADTQISMRFAQQIACHTADLDCSGYDFIYTIRADSGIIGGPSAGGAAAVLTYSLLTGHELREGVAVTGTINSGGLLGAVGGLSHKISAAQQQGFHTVAIPFGTRSFEENNQTIDLIKYGANKGVLVTEVATLSDLIHLLTGETLLVSRNYTLDPHYLSVMQGIATDLCTRSSTLRDLFYTQTVSSSISSLSPELLHIENATQSIQDRGSLALKRGDYYSGASYCFRSSVNYEYLRFALENLTAQEILTRARLIAQGIRQYRSAIESHPPTTIHALQSSIVVSDRLVEAEEYLEALETVSQEDPLYRLSFANERLHSALVWGRFAQVPGASYLVDPEQLALACSRKIQEAQERYQYVQFYIPESLERVRLGIERAGRYQNEKKYPLCLFTSAQAKAEADVVVGVIGANAESLPALLDLKLSAVESAIASSQAKGFFPIVGYSYYEYARSLREQDATSALLFAEYALELSNLDLYFPQKKTVSTSLWMVIPLIALLLFFCVAVYAYHKAYG